MTNAQIIENPSIIQSGDLEGYPTQKFHPEETLNSSALAEDVPYSFLIPKSMGIVFPVLTIPQSKVKYDGIWKQVGKHMVPTNGNAQTFSHIRHEAVTKGVAHEASVGLEASVTAGAKPFGVGVEVTVSASVGYALTLSTETTFERESASSVCLEPGYGGQWWERELKVNAQVDASYFDKYPNTPQGWLQFYDDIVRPSFKPMGVELAADKPDSDSDTLAKSLGYLYPRNQVTMPGTFAFTMVVGALSILKKEGLSAEYTLPGAEIYLTRYVLEE